MIQVATETADAEGQSVKAWNDFLKTWARVEFLSGRELEAMQKINSDISIRFTMRFNETVVDTMRLSWRSNYWNIHAILPDERRDYMAVMASKVE